MAKINPYLNFLGKTEEAFNFYKSVFGGEFLTLQRFKDTPHGDKMSAEDKEKIMHVALPIGGNILMGTDALETMGQSLKFGDNISIAIDPESIDEANKLFNALAAGGKVIMPMEKMFWGAWFGMLVDAFGVQWMVNYNDSQQ
ncbi:VOC family protein [Mucilaginibacter sp. UR6-11]|uniref:VOC family protein n=1 Tax=Mucilaginibacter sp. UR6-11 TaxID=1435644 RepID=UPI001E4C436C|nr:VOC family protein [Mucilaginibacter sp. UR6-11]MCC8426146.1 VOC family protein [Mucilaginibacter sp. UR6-11]